MPRLFFVSIFLCAAIAMPLAGKAQNARPEQAEAVAWESILCTATLCSKLEARGFLFAKPGQKKAVLISHGSQGIDSRMYDYVDSLDKEGYAALVIDHWTPRGITVTHNDYVDASKRGGNEFNMAADSLTAAAWLRARGFERIGSIGESQGGGAAVMMQQKFAHALIERNVRRLYGKEFQVRPVDAVVGMYGFCGYRNTRRDAYAGTPFLFITAGADDETPSKYCERHVGWMNQRGGNASIVVMEGAYHSFDAPYPLRYSSGQHYARCDILIDESGTTELNSGMKAPGDDVAAMLARCISRGYHTGAGKDRFIAVPHWIAFFKQHL